MLICRKKLKKKEKKDSKTFDFEIEKLLKIFGENYDEIGRKICLFYTDIYERKCVRSGPQISRESKFPVLK